MSDVAGPGVASTGLPYLTGYPLADSGVYALSMTWPAPEMPRPGCVWTHTLLISFADLAVMDVPSALTALFKCPTNHLLDGYGEALAVGFSSPYREQIDGDAAKCLALFATALYGHPSEQIWARRPTGVDVDDVVLRIWDQQWPRLRRSFKFCTLTSRDRSQDVLQFDLQLTWGGSSSSKLRFASNLDGYEATNVHEAPWLADLVRDAMQPSRSSLRQMLRRLGADILGGREAMSPICTLHAVLEGVGTQALSLAVDIVEQVPPLSSSALAKTIVLKALVQNADSFESEHVLRFVLEQYELLPPIEVVDYSESLARFVWKADPQVFVVTSYDGAESVRLALRRGASSIDLESVLQELPRFTNLAEPLLSLFPQLARDKRFWEQTQTWPSSVESLGIDFASPETLNAMVSGLHDEGAINSTLHVAGAPAVLVCLDGLLRQEFPTAQLNAWMRRACIDVNGVATFLSHGGQHSPEFLLYLTDFISPDAVPNDTGDDPWFVALANLRAAKGALPVELCAYGLRRALGWRSMSVEPLLRITFEPLHEAAIRQAIPSSSWNLLEGSLPWVLSSESWDSGLKLRRAVAKKCVDLPVGPKGFIELVESDQLFLDLLDAIWQIWIGGRYLRSVKDWLNHSPNPAHTHRLKVVKKFLKSHSLF